MRQLAAYLITVELLLGLVAVQITREMSAADSFAASPLATAPSGGQSDSPIFEREPSRSRSRDSISSRSSPPPGSRRGRTANTASNATTRAAGIAFEMPRDFATGATPSAAAFNWVSGDQTVPLQQAHATLGDGIAAGDFDGDGNTDVAQTNVIAGSVSVFLGLGNSGFKAPQVHAVGVHPTFLIASHLDGDDHLDLAVADATAAVVVLRGDGRGAFTVAQRVPVAAPRNVAVGDFNRDRVPDLAVASGGPACPRTPTKCAESVSPVGGVAILSGSADEAGQVSFKLTQFVTHTHGETNHPVSANYVAVADFDGSGFDDLAVGVGTSAAAGDRTPDGGATGDDVLVYLNRNDQEEQPFRATPSQPALRVGATPDAIAVGDWNGDMHLDLAVLANNSLEVTTLLGDSAGRFVRKATNATVSGLPRSLQVGDFDNDGNADLVTASFHSSSVGVLRGRGDGTFDPAVDFWAGEAPTAVDVGDFDGDGRLDIVTPRLRTDQLSLLRNHGPRPGDGVRITRDLPYIDAAEDPMAVHHTVDVYRPPVSTPSFAGTGKPYPVVLFVHGGGGISQGKSVATYLLRSLAREGIVVVSTNYRLGPGQMDGAVADVAEAFRWTRANVKEIDGDPNSIILFGHSAGGDRAAIVATALEYADLQEEMRGLVMAGASWASVTEKPTRWAVRPSSQPASLLLSGTEGIESGLQPFSAAFAELSRQRGAESEHRIIPGRDHLTLLGNMARPGDPARSELLNFMRAVWAAS